MTKIQTMKLALKISKLLLVFLISGVLLALVGELLLV